MRFHVEALDAVHLLSACLCVHRVHRFGKLSGTAVKKPVVLFKKINRSGRRGTLRLSKRNAEDAETGTHSRRGGNSFRGSTSVEADPRKPSEPR